MTPHAMRIAFISVTCWVAGAVVAIPVALADGPVAGDVGLTKLIQHSPGWLEPAARAVRALTTTEAILIAGLALVAILFAARLRYAALALALGAIILPLAQSGAKEIVDRPRPTSADVEVRDTWTSTSFPSGHVMSGTFLYLYFVFSPAIRSRLAPRMRTGVRSGALAIIAANAVANVYMGVHWPTDVLGGLLFGSGLALAVVALEHQLRPRRAPASTSG